MKIVHEIYDDCILVYDADESPFHPHKLKLAADHKDIELCKKELREDREWEIANGKPKDKENFEKALAAVRREIAIEEQNRIAAAFAAGTWV